MEFTRSVVLLDGVLGGLRCGLACEVACICHQCDLVCMALFDILKTSMQFVHLGR